MLEARRQQYLSILGIENYMPSRVLPGAPPSALMPDESLLAPDSSAELESGLSVEGDTSDTIPNETASSLSLADSVSDNIGQSVSALEALVESNNPVTSPAIIEPVEQHGESAELLPATDDKVQQSVEFVLNVWRICDECLVLDSRRPGAALPTDKLLQNMLRAVGYPLAQLPKSEIIRWPLFANHHLGRQQSDDVAQACAMVQAYIHAQMIKAPVNNILLMGEAAASYSLGEGHDFESLIGTLVKESQWNVNIAVLPSLIAMLEEPLQKAVAWKALQAMMGEQ